MDFHQFYPTSATFLTLFDNERHIYSNFDTQASWQGQEDSSTGCSRDSTRRDATRGDSTRRDSTHHLFSVDK